MTEALSPPPAFVERVSAEDLASTALGLARRFHRGATMWCVAPDLPSHGRHVAVEFVHPVIVGKRALPTVHVEAADLAGTLRLLARPGDVLIVVGSADGEVVTDLLRRAGAWGLLRITMGAGAPAEEALAEHVVALTGLDPAVAARSGDLVMLYHLLWELTHVVFEHPGLLESDFERTGDVCITCSDQAEVAEVRAAHDGGTSAECVLGGRAVSVDVSLVEDCRAFDLVLVHAGVALSALPGLRAGSGGGELARPRREAAPDRSGEPL